MDVSYQTVFYPYKGHLRSLLALIAKRLCRKAAYVLANNVFQ